MILAAIPLHREFEYAYSNGRVWAFENRLLGKEKILKLLEAEGLKGAISALEGTDYYDLLKARELDEALDTAISELYILLGSFFPEKKLLTPFLKRHELMREKVFSSFKEDEIESGIIEVDKAILKEKLDLARKVKGFEAVIKAEIDIANLRIYLRAAKLGKTGLLEKSLLDGGAISKFAFLKKDVAGISLDFEHKHGKKYKNLPETYKTSPPVFDKDCDNLVAEKARGLKRVLLGQESLISYIYEKEMEVKNLGIVLKSKQMGIDPKIVKPLIRG